MINKLTIGSANFGLEYGIANNKKLSGEEVFKILESALDSDVWGIDTAKAYGDAERVIGRFFAQKGKVFKVITKLPEKEYSRPKDVEREILESLENMNIQFIDFVLMHSYKTYKKYGKIIVPVLSSLCKDKIIGSYGISVYHPDEALNLIAAVKDKVAIEFPLNLFDRRFLKDNVIGKMKAEGNLLFARSVFLQGLFFLEESGLKGDFERITDKIKIIRELSGEFNMSPAHMALLFVITNPFLDGVVLGVDSKEHLSTNLSCFTKENIERFDFVRSRLLELETEDEDILLPYRWGMS